MDALDPWFGKSAMLSIIAAIILIRTPYGNQSIKIPIVEKRRGAREVCALALAWLGSTILPLTWVFSPLFAFADYPLSGPRFLCGVIISILGLWLFRQSHIELGKNWSISLDVREGHQLVTTGLYHYMRHPMYTSIFLYALGQALVVPNWFVGPANLVAFFVLFALRVGSEEQMMTDKFRQEYQAYKLRTKRLIPFVY